MMIVFLILAREVPNLKYMTYGYTRLKDLMPIIIYLSIPSDDNS